MRRLFLTALLALALTGGASAQNKVLVGVNAPVSMSATPVLSGAGNTVTYTQPPGSATTIAPSIAAACSCSNLTGATVIISAGGFTGDVLNIATTTGITTTYTFAAGVGTLTLSGTTSVTNYNKALQSANYASSSNDPTNGGTPGSPGTGGNPTRTITFQVSNGANLSNQPTSTINVNLGAQIPTLSGTGSSVNFVSGGTGGGGTGAVTLESAITVGGPSTTLTGATVSIAGGFLSLDTLSATLAGVITQSYNANTGVLSLSGTDTLANYQTVLRSIQYNSTATDPANSGANFTRSINWQVVNGSTPSPAVARTTVNIANPLQPTLTVVAGNQVSFTAGGSPVAVDSALGLTCTCTTLTGASLTPGAYPNSFQIGDVLTAASSTLSPTTSITQAYNTSTGVLTLSGSDTIAHYLAALQSVTYGSPQSDPTANGRFPSRVLIWGASNGTLVAPPVTSTVNIILPGQPSWVTNGASVALNPASNQAWISGTGTVALSTQVQVTRATTETCYTGGSPAVSYASPGSGCVTASGLPVWGTYTNFMTYSNDASQAAVWNPYHTGSGTITITGNAVLSPDGANTTAAQVSISRTSAGDYAQPINNNYTNPVGSYPTGLWLKLDPTDTNYASCQATPSTCNKVVQFSTLGPGVYSVVNNVLTANWVNYASTLTASSSACVSGGSPNCGIGIGYTNQAGSGPTLNACSTAAPCAAVFDVWGGEVNSGAALLPTIPTGANPAASASSVVKVVPGSALENALTGTAFSIIANTTGSQLGIASTIFDSNGTTLLGKTSTNLLTSTLGASTLTTANGAAWTGAASFGYAKDGVGRSMALNGGVVVTDNSQVSVATPITLGSTPGASANTNFFNGYLGLTNVFTYRVPNSQLGSSGVGNSYYFTAATDTPPGVDTNPCTQAAPCASLQKAGQLNLFINDTVYFQGGETFPGCIVETGGGNWNATRTQPITFTSYGTGQATITPNCTAANSQTAPIIFKSADGAVLNNIKIQGDAAGNAAYGIMMENCDTTKTHGNMTFENMTFTGVNTAANVGQFSSDITVRTDMCGGSQMYDHLVALNNTVAGATINATDSPFMAQPGFQCAQQWDEIQGNLVYNIGGINAGAAYVQGTGIELNGMCPLGSTFGNQASANPNGGPSAIVQFNVVHDNGANITNNCGFYQIWTAAVDSVVIRMNETYNAYGTNATACDHGAFDFDLSSVNSLAERNYSHNDWGACNFVFSGNNGGSTPFTGSDTYRWNICDNDGKSNQGSVVASQAGSALVWYYNNIYNHFPNTAVGNGSPVVYYNGCPAAGSLFANNVVIDGNNATQYMFSIGGQNNTTQCVPAAVGNLKIANNEWYSSTHPGNSLVVTTDHQHNTPPNGSTGSYSAMATLIGETGGLNVNPQFQGTMGGNTLCNSTAGSLGPQANNNCPAAYQLSAGSPLAAGAGANLVSSTYGLPTTIGGTPNKFNGMGTLTYYGDALPCPSGFPIGVDCGTPAAVPPAPTITSPANGSTVTTATPLISGTGTSGSTLNLSIDGSIVTTISQSSSSWSFQVVTALSAGSHTASATQSNGSGTSPTGSVTFTVNLTPSPPTITSPTSGQTFSTQTPTITGNGTSGATVNISIDGSAAGTATVTSGAWSFVTSTLSVASHTVSATQTLNSQTSSACVQASPCPISFSINTSVTMHLDFTTGTLPSGTTFTGGAGASYYDASNVLHIANPANTPRFDHNPSNGAVLGILLDPAVTNSIYASNMSASASHYTGATQTGCTTTCPTGDLSHTLFFNTPGSGLQQYTAGSAPWFSVNSSLGTGNNTGPTNVALSAGVMTEDTHAYDPNCGGCGHPSTNNAGPSNPYPSTAVVWSQYVKLDSGSQDGQSYLIDGAGNSRLQMQFNLTTCVPYGTATTPGTWTYSGGVGQVINISGNQWCRETQWGTTDGNNLAGYRNNIGICNSGCSGQTPNPGNGTDGIAVYGVMYTSRPNGNPPCTPGTSGQVPCMSNSYVDSPSMSAYATTTADVLTITSIPSGINFLIYTFDDGSTQKKALSCSPSCTGVSNFPVPTNPPLNRPWIKLIDGSVN